MSDNFSPALENSKNRTVAWWLLCGVIMIYLQIVIGGITRLTGSGLSITKWEIITGTLPPLNETTWKSEFEKYRATPQYKKLNEGMSLSEFKYIYFWEYFHRLWARLMGFVFAIPFAIFLFQKRLDAPLVRKLILLILLASLVASFGWLMVKSGLVDRPWVDAYKLTMHLSLALITYGYLLWLFMSLFFSEKHFTVNPALKTFTVFLLVILSFQLFLGGLMSGLRAGLLYPTFPDMNGNFIPPSLKLSENWTLQSFIEYDANVFFPTFVQFIHRGIAYIFVLLTAWFTVKALRTKLNAPHKILILLLPVITLLQVLLGILTVINFKGEVPVTLGVLHQAVAILLLTNLLAVWYLFKKSPEYKS